jgi:hypothetical protein
MELQSLNVVLTRIFPPIIIKHVPQQSSRDITDVHDELKYTKFCPNAHPPKSSNGCWHQTWRSVCCWHTVLLANLFLLAQGCGGTTCFQLRLEHVGPDPVWEDGDVGVDTRQLLPGAPYTPRHEADEGLPPVVGQRQRTSGITLLESGKKKLV